MEQVGMEASSRRSMENHCLVNLFEFEFIGKNILTLNIIKNGKHYSLQVQNKGFMSKNLGELLLGCPV